MHRCHHCHRDSNVKVVPGQDSHNITHPSITYSGCSLCSNARVTDITSNFTHCSCLSDINLLLIVDGTCATHWLFVCDRPWSHWRYWQKQWASPSQRSWSLTRTFYRTWFHPRNICFVINQPTHRLDSWYCIWQNNMLFSWTMQCQIQMGESFGPDILLVNSFCRSSVVLYLLA